MSHQSSFNLTGPAGALEAVWTEPDSQGSPAYTTCAVLCHPHPQYGGSMHDAVLQTVEGVLLEQQVPCLRFNFRGVGGSAGSYANGIGEAMDVVAALQWLQATQPQAQRLLAGYSFGAAAAFQAASQNECPQLASLWLVAPPVALLNMASGNPESARAPNAIFHPDADDFTDLDTLHQWCSSWPEPAPSVTTIAGANHFFTGAQSALAVAVRDQWQQQTGH